MSAALRQTLLAAIAVALATSALGRLYADQAWLAPALGIIAAVAVTGALARHFRAPVILQAGLSLLVVLVYLPVVFVPGTVWGATVPGRGSGAALLRLVRQGLSDARQLAPPVPSHQGLVLLAVLGIGAVAIAVDLLAAGLQSAGVAGFPLLLLFVVPAGIRPGGAGVLPFALAAAGWLALLAGEGNRWAAAWGPALRPPPRSSPGRPDTTPAGSAAGRAGWRIGTVALCAGVVVPGLVPGLHGRLVGKDGPFGTHGSGHTATTYNPITRLRGDLLTSKATPLLRYTTTDPDPDYLRLTTLDRFDGHIWSSSQLTGSPDSDAVQRGIPTPVGLAESPVPIRIVQDEIAVGPLHTSWLPLPFPPKSIEVRGPWVWDRRAETAFSSETYADQIGRPYFVTALRVLPTPGSLQDPGRLPAAIAPYAVPPQLSPYVMQQALAATSGADTEIAKVLALQQYFLNPHRFHYATSSDVPQVTSPNALERFLRGGRGFCEQYSSAMAAMVRFLGIPARVAVGFTPGRRQRDGSYLVTTHDAHAWPEVWFGGAGWVRFEPTPRAGHTTVPGYAEPAGPATAPAPGGSAAPRPRPVAIPSLVPRTTTGKNLDKALRDQAALRAPRLTARPAGGSVALWAVLGFLLLVVLLLGTGPWLLGRLRRRHRRAQLTPAEAAWAEVVDAALDVGHLRRPADSPRAAAREILARRDLPAPAAAALTRLALAAERSRYARVGVESGESRDGDVGAVRGGLLHGLPLWSRWRVVVFPPSTLGWALERAGTIAADGVDRAEQALSSAWQVVERRRVAG